MSVLTKRTAKMLCSRAGIARTELTEEAQKLYDLYNDPQVGPEQKEIVKHQLDEAILRMEEKVATTRRVKGEHGA